MTRLRVVSVPRRGPGGPGQSGGQIQGHPGAVGGSVPPGELLLLLEPHPGIRLQPQCTSVAERKRRGVAERRRAVRLRLLAPRQRVQHHPAAEQHGRHQRDGHAGKSSVGGPREACLWVVTQASSHSGYEHLQHAGEAPSRSGGGGGAEREDRGAGQSDAVVALTETWNELGAAGDLCYRRGEGNPPRRTFAGGLFVCF